jgi:predicted 3-demethylubiquinone-9 3-methyltransferase (glyoxalase superfamily)
VKHARFTLCGREYRCFDSPVGHAFDFTPSASLLIECDSEGELEQLYGALSAGGKVLLSLGDYGYGRKFAWVTDRFGVSWQLNLA